MSDADEHQLACALMKVNARCGRILNPDAMAAWVGGEQDGLDRLGSCVGALRSDVSKVIPFDAWLYTTH